MIKFSSIMDNITLVITQYISISLDKCYAKLYDYKDNVSKFRPLRPFVKPKKDQKVTESMICDNSSVSKTPHCSF